MDTEQFLYGDELLVAAFGQLKPKSSFRIADESDVVNAFYQAREKKKFAIFFKNYAFDTDGLKPISPAISEGLDTLQQSRLVGRMNPDLVDYTIDPALKTRYEQSVKKKLAGKEHLARDLADEIKSRLRIEEPA